MPKLLVIDDEPNIHLQYRTGFRWPGNAGVGRGKRPKKACDWRPRNRPDVILLDIRLGDRSGLDVFHELRRIDPKMPRHLHHRPRHDRHGHRGHEAGRLRLSGQAAGCRSTATGCRPGLRHQPADARARPSLTRETAPRTSPTADRQRRRHADRLQADRPRGARRMSTC